MPPNETPTLYTSCEHDGAMAEIVHHWSQLTPLPSKPVIVHTLGLRLATAQNFAVSSGGTDQTRCQLG